MEYLIIRGVLMVIIHEPVKKPSFAARSEGLVNYEDKLWNISIRCNIFFHNRPNKFFECEFFK